MEESSYILTHTAEQIDAAIDQTETNRQAIAGKASVNHNHDSAYASKSHTHSDKQDVISDLAAIRSNASAGATHASSVHAPTDAQKNVQSDWNATSGDAFIKNKPTIPTIPASLPANGGRSDTTNKMVPSYTSKTVSAVEETTIKYIKLMTGSYKSCGTLRVHMSGNAEDCMVINYMAGDGRRARACGWYSTASKGIKSVIINRGSNWNSDYEIWLQVEQIKNAMYIQVANYEGDATINSESQFSATTTRPTGSILEYELDNYGGMFGYMTGYSRTTHTHSDYVEKVTGKSLSTNDFTNVAKSVTDMFFLSELTLDTSTNTVTGLSHNIDAVRWALEDGRTVVLKQAGDLPPIITNANLSDMVSGDYWELYFMLKKNLYKVTILPDNTIFVDTKTMWTL